MLTISHAGFLMQLIPVTFDSSFFSQADLAVEQQQVRISKDKEAVLSFLKLMTEVRVLRGRGGEKL